MCIRLIRFGNSSNPYFCTNLFALRVITCTLPVITPPAPKVYEKSFSVISLRNLQQLERLSALVLSYIKNDKPFDISSHKKSTNSSSLNPLKSSFSIHEAVNTGNVNNDFSRSFLNQPIKNF